jgi:hypothetical protein
MDDAVKKRLEELLILAMDKTISPEQINEVNTLLRGHPDRIRFTVRFLQVASHLRQSKKLASMTKSWLAAESQDSFDGFMRLMAEYENTAEAVELEKAEEVPARPPVSPAPVAPERPRASRLSIFTLLVSSAALFCLIAYVTFSPTAGRVETATVHDSFGARWLNSDQDQQMKKGSRLATHSEPLCLQEGLVELRFDNNARVVIEGPAQFQIVTGDRIGLEYGKVYAAVPPEAIGFSIYTKNAKIIDLGTEFGIEIGRLGDTCLHMIKGKARLIAGKESEPVSMEVSQGSAKKVSGRTQTVSDVSCDERLFVRAFDSSSRAVWRQEPFLDLADIVRGGNGLGTGNSRVRLHPIKGFCEEYFTGFATVPDYLPIPQLPFIDGIFVPDGEKKQIVSTRGDIFEACPDTSGIVNMDLLATPVPEIFKTELRGEGTIRFNGQEYSDRGKPCIVMHANHGITFDLEAIRQAYPFTISRFVSQIGIADLRENCPCNADFWVVVDGQMRYSLQQYRQKGVLNDVTVEIKDTDRFLTLVTTDGGDPDYPEGGFYKRAISCDWCIFAEPRLVLR